MDKELRLSAIYTAVTEYEQTKERLRFAAKMALSTEDWQALKTCTEKLISVQNMFAVLNAEAEQLRELIKAESELEKMEAIL